MKNTEIYLITEAFSMQPISIRVGQHVDNGDIKSRRIVTKILLESINQAYYYVGYDVDGNKLFQYLKKSVNVHFKT